MCHIVSYFNYTEKSLIHDFHWDLLFHYKSFSLYCWHKLFGLLWQALSKHFTCFILLERSWVPGIVWPSSSGTVHLTVSYPYFPQANQATTFLCLQSSISSRRYVSSKPKHIKPRVRRPKHNLPRVSVEIHAGPVNVKDFAALDVWNGHSAHVPHCLLLPRDVGN